MSETPTDAFSSWYGGLDSVIEYAVANDPKVETKVREPFILDGKLIDNGCEDKNEKCKWWAEIGECQKNPGCVILSLFWFALVWAACVSLSLAATLVACHTLQHLLP
jgi:hypothetical protein